MHRVIPTHGPRRTAPGRRTVRLLCAGLFALAAPPAAAAGPRAKALAAIEAGNLRDAKKYLAKLDEYLASATKEIPPQAVGFRYQIEARYHQERGKEADALKALRQACLVHPGGKPNPKLLGEGPLVDTYYAVCTEVQQRAEVDLATLELPDAPVRIDGLAPGGEFPVLQGRHLVQVQCANDTWSTQWSELKAPAEWAAGCPDGALAAAEAELSDDPMDIVPFFGGDDAGDEGETATTEPGAAPEAPPDEPVEEAAPAEPPAPAPEPSTESASAAPAPAPGNYSLTIQCTPDPCTVKLDGADQGATDLDLKVGTGEHTLELAAGDKTLKRTLSLKDSHSGTTMTWNHAQNSVEIEHRDKE